MPLTNHLRNLLRQRRQSRLLDELAEEVALEYRAAVWQRVFHSIIGMSRAEARGYTRARAGDYVAAGVDAVSRKHRLEVATASQVAARATERLVELIIEDLSIAQLRGKQKAAA